ncbi:hypothetical protein KVK62_07375 [Helicobacter pylori]|uniref:DUF3226 domain-containing protein n=1 Tax=Helicobacter pylori TaxID=210 RepID=UPI000EABD06C|nr:DUF3226 domain-containing protein [Helicobacter pylori]RKU95091.1 hypothetical protein DDP38_07380 [Helicobacter pylori]RKU95438.1 hypothetical protein DDP34_07350 [Helicobacter pylori]RKU98683.1 hypothetical protein DDP42_07495 [Helicobacter pylori]WQW60897.1 hypothetical protein KVK62_07375 [Helicobacter pylori]WQY12477.1 hypothetical protein KVK20_07320 [Helicobacter pylori]
MREKIVYVEGESDKIFLTLLNEFRNLRINGENIVSCKGNTKLFKEAESIKEYLKAKDIYIVFDSDNQTKETKIQEIKKQLQENPEEEHRLNDEEFNQIKIFLLPENDETKHDLNYCELEHLLEKMAKESENKAFYTSFRQHYNTLFNEVKQIKPIQSEQKRRAKCWLQPYIMLSVCLKKGFVPCGLNDLDPVSTTAKMIDKPKNTEILKKFFNFNLKELQALIDFLN